MSESMVSTPTSEASTKVGSDALSSSRIMAAADDPKASQHSAVSRDSSSLSSPSTSLPRLDLSYLPSTERDLMLFLVALRLLNALTINTFFQPDEYFQALEPAWRIAFGEESGAWITWEWRHQLRSALHPYLFAGVYWLADRIALLLRLSAPWRAELLVAAPKVLQAGIAARGDFYTWKLGERLYGRGSLQAWACLALSIASPWQWFVSTRTFSNCLETTLTVVALEAWPWQWAVEPSSADRVVDGLRAEANAGPEADPDADAGANTNTDAKEDGGKDTGSASSSSPAGAVAAETEPPTGFVPSQLFSEIRYKSLVMTVFPHSRVQRSLLLAALACVLRPTNLLIWAVLATYALVGLARREELVRLRWTSSPLLVTTSQFMFNKATARERQTLVAQTVICGSFILAISAGLDYTLYGQLTFPPLKFLYFNIVRSLAVFYGRNDWHYYLSQGYPLLLTTFLPFAVVGLYQALACDERLRLTRVFHSMRYQLALVSLFVPFVLSFVSHKEVRFIYPLLPVLHVLAAAPAAACFEPALVQQQQQQEPPASPKASSNSGSNSGTGNRQPQTRRGSSRLLLYRYRPSVLPLLLLLNVAIGLFVTQCHNRGILSTMEYLRREHEALYLTQPPARTHLAPAGSTMTVGFLMPCHSTPWRSHLVHPTIHAWALGCEPPLLLPSGAAEAGGASDAYLDEADRFYLSPERFIKDELGGLPLRGRTGSSNGGAARSFRSGLFGGSSGGSSSSGSSIGGSGRGGFGSQAFSSSSSFSSTSGQKPLGGSSGTAWDGGQGRKEWPEYLVFFAGLEPVLEGLVGGAGRGRGAGGGGGGGMVGVGATGYVPCWRGWNSWFHDDWRRRGDVVVWCLRPRRGGFG